MTKFTEDPQLVTAEQHALDNEGHKVAVTAVRSVVDNSIALVLACETCAWWDHQLYGKEV